jgi:predicted RNA-binding Zn-ribbon protein involved in translation (DUF1610 family)
METIHFGPSCAGVDAVGRRGIKEYRAAEALQLILADRDREQLSCPSCGYKNIDRTPKRRLPRARFGTHRQVTLKCGKCGRQAAYVPRNVTQPSDKELVGQ